MVHRNHNTGLLHTKNIIYFGSQCRDYVLCDCYCASRIPVKRDISSESISIAEGGMQGAVVSGHVGGYAVIWKM